jgi:hypothetical protein
MAVTELLLPLRSLFEWVDALPSSVELRGTQYLYSWIIVAHVMTMAMFAGLIVFMDVRLLGAGHMRTPFSQIQRRLFPWQMTAFALAVITGGALLYAQPLRYYTSVYFWMKLATMGLAGLNALAFEYVTVQTMPAWDAARRPPAAARLAGCLSLVLWAVVIIEGRLIPYALTWFPSE